MIPIPNPKESDLDSYCKSVITYISNTTNGKTAIDLINFALNKIENKLTLYKLLRLETNQFEKIEGKYNKYKKYILPKLQKPLFEKPHDDWSKAYNNENIFYNKIITFK